MIDWHHQPLIRFIMNCDARIEKVLNPLITKDKALHAHKPSLPAYYRSKLFNSNIGINSLVASAHPVLSLIERLKLTQSLPDIELIHDNLTHELDAFESKASNIQYAEETVLLGRYLLSATLDEILAKNLQRLNKKLEFQAFTQISHDGVGPEQYFFEILEKALQAPSLHLELLELIYLCLNAGYEGKYHEMINGRQTLEDKTEQLYQAIKRAHTHAPVDLFKREIKPQPPAVKRINKKSFIYLAGAAALIVSSLAVNHQLIEHKAQTLLHQRHPGLLNE